jgi:predicted transglutaminase-like cysteine proteinase
MIAVKITKILMFVPLMLLGACATPGAQSGLAAAGSPFMPSGITVDAPEGYVAMCKRSPDMCPEQAAQVGLAPMAASTEPSRALDAASQGIDAVVAIPAAVEAASLAAPAVATVTPATLAPTQPTSPMLETTTPTGGTLVPATIISSPTGTATQPAGATGLTWRMSLLNQVNRRVNGSVRQVTALLHYGDDDYWTRSGTGIGAEGDCKEIAIEKRLELIAQGYPANDLFYAIAFREDLGFHAVLIAHTQSGDVVLDSRSPYIVRWTEAPYIWAKRQASGDSTNWALIGGPARGYADLRVASLDRSSPIGHSGTTSVSQ